MTLSLFSRSSEWLSALLNQMRIGKRNGIHDVGGFAVADYGGDIGTGTSACTKERSAVTRNA